MRLLKPVYLTSLVTLSLFVVTAFFACKKKEIKYNDTTLVRPCDNVICLNGGSCSDGLCYCAAGFEGTKCDKKWSDRYIGTYKASDDCYNDSINPYYLVNILPVPSFAQRINIQNLGTACPGTIIEATINAEKTSFIIPSQTTCGNIYISGNGNINGGFINVYLVQRDSSAHTSKYCSIILDKQ
jgi:hypothetical protein